MFDEKKFINEHPLVLFSVYTDIQTDSLLRIGTEIIESMKKFSPTKAEDYTPKTYGLFWLWILGAYEVIRVMNANSDCFNKKTQAKLEDLKEKLAKIRIPFAKQERRGSNKKGRYNIGNALSITEFKKGDMGFTIDSENFFFKPIFKEFKKLLTKIKPTDIKFSLEEKHRDN
jgi:hypothetical protein